MPIEFEPQAVLRKLFARVTGFWSFPDLQVRSAEEALSALVEQLEARQMLTAAPVFDPTAYSWTTAESVSVGTGVGTVSATDADGDQLTYTLDTPNVPFAVDAATGLVSVVEHLDAHTAAYHSFIVTATDTSGNAATATVGVTLNAAPEFTESDYAFQVAPGIGPGTHVGNVWADDPEGTQVTYELRGPADYLFVIDQAGQLQTSAAFASVPASMHRVTVRATDAGGAFRETEVTVLSGPRSETPTFPSGDYHFTLSDEQPLGTEVGQINAFDPSGGAVGYAIVDGGLGSMDVFSINASTGVISLSEEVDYLDRTHHAFWVIATNSLGRSAASFVVVTLADHGSQIVPGNWQTAISTGSSFDSTSWGYWDPGVTWNDVHVGDIDGDNRDDIVGRHHTEGRWQVAFAGASGFHNEDWGGWSAAATWVDVRTGHFNDDEKMDIAGRSNGNWWVGLSDTDSNRFVTSHWGSWSASAAWADVRVGDFDGDGRDDLVGRSNGNWWLSRSNGSGFDNPTVWASWSNTAQWSDVRVGDFDGDGADDLVGRTAPGGLWVTRDTGSGSVTTHWGAWTGGTAWENVHAVDVTGDGRADLIGRSGVEWWVSVSQWNATTGTDEFAAVSSWGTWTDSSPFDEVLTGDFDGDGVEDVAGLSAGTWHVGLSTGSVFQTTNWGTWSTDWEWETVRSGDFNADGKSDLVGRAGDGPAQLSPAFSTAYTLTVAESATAGTLAGTISAKDPRFSALTYEMSVPGSVPFTVDPDGAVRVSGVLDYDAGDEEFTFEVRAVAPDGVTGTTYVTIRVLRVEDAPYFVAADLSSTVSEDAFVGVSVGAVPAVDPQGRTLTYTIEGSDLFFADSAGVVRVAGPLDAEAAVTHVFEVVATAPDGNQVRINAIVAVTNVEESPTFDTQAAGGYFFNASSSLEVGDQVGSVAAEDPQGDAVTYSLAPGQDGLPFEVDSLTGAVTLSGSLAGLEGTVYDVQVVGSDGVNSDTVTVQVAVTDESDPGPVFDAPHGYEFAVDENTAAGDLLGFVRAAATAGDVTYQISSTDPNLPVAINAQSGALTVVGVLDYEQASGHTFEVIATAEGVQRSVTVTVIVNDVEERPDFDERGYYFFGLRNDTPVGTVVGAVSATDPQSDAVTYAFDTGFNASDAFTIDPATGEIALDQSFASMTTIAYEYFRVTASDGTHTSLVDVTVVIFDEYIVSPVFRVSPESFSVAEDAPDGAWVGDVEAIDPEGETLSYWIEVPAGQPDVPFTVDADGQLHLDGELDYETEPSYAFNVVASDGVNESRLSVEVHVGDVAEAPVFVEADYIYGGDFYEYYFYLYDNAAVGALVGSVLAVDPQPEDVVGYTIVEGAAVPFAVDGTGTLTVSGALGAPDESYTFTVVASDGENEATAEVTVTLWDSGTAPYFGSQHYTFSVEEDSGVGTAVGSPVAFDFEADLVSIEIDAPPGTVPFTVGMSGGGDQASAVIRVAGPLDVDVQDQYAFDLVATDAAGNTGRTTVSVLVYADNDAPTLEDAAFEILENSGAGTLVGDLSPYASDPDDDPLTYSIVSGNTGGAFSISNSGAISVANVAALDYEQTPVFDLVVEVSDGELTDTANVTISLLDVLPVVRIEAGAPAAWEPDHPGGVGIDATFTLLISGDLPYEPIAVNYRIDTLPADSAVLGTDYVLTLDATDTSPGVTLGAATGALSLSATEWSRTIRVTPLADDLLEGPETVTLTLDPGTDYELAGGGETSPGSGRSAVATIHDRTTLSEITVWASEPVTEGESGTFTIMRTNPFEEATVSLSFAGTANMGDVDAGGDYTVNGNLDLDLEWGPPATLTFGVGDFIKTIQIDTHRDALHDEGDETVELTVGAFGPANYVVAVPTATLTIQEPEGVWVLAENPEIREDGESGVFLIGYNGETDQDVIVRFQLGGEATAGADYDVQDQALDALPPIAARTYEVTIPAGSATTRVNIFPVDDDKLEGHEPVELTLISASRYSILPDASEATILIRDNDEVVDVDLDVDNDDGFGRPSRTEAEDATEDDLPGKYIEVNSHDWDGDYVFGTNDFDDSARFVPLVVEVSPGLFDDAGAMLVVTYDSSKVRLWRKPGDRRRDPLPVINGGDYIAPGTYEPDQLWFSKENTTRVFYVEGLNGGPVEISVEALVTDLEAITDALGPDATQDSVAATVTYVDLDIDSDNGGGLTRSDQEEIVEDRADQPGHMITQATYQEDFDNDDIPDSTDTQIVGREFSTLVLEVGPQFTTDLIDSAAAKIRISYNATDPAAATYDAASGQVTLPPGTLRIWTKDAGDLRDPQGVSTGGDYLAPGTYTLQDLLQGSTVTWYMEGARPTDVLERILVEIDPDGTQGSSDFLLHDAVRVQTLPAPPSIIDIAIDSDNDGRITSQDDSIEATPGLPGKYIEWNVHDKDLDGVPNVNDDEAWKPHAARGVISVPWHVIYADDPATTIEVSYGPLVSADANPRDPASGGLRLWSRRYNDTLHAYERVEIPPGFYSLEQLGLNYGTNRADFYLEGTAPSLSAGAELVRVTLFHQNETHVDEIRATVIAVDADVDTDNTNGPDLPDRSEAEERREELDGESGKILLAVHGDEDGDGTDDRIDWQVDAPGSGFAPLVIEVSDALDLSQARFRFDYLSSDPAGAVWDDIAGEVILPADASGDVGHVRLWRKDAAEMRDPSSVGAGGDYVSTEETYSFAELGGDTTTRTITFYMEGLERTFGAEQLTVEVDPLGTFAQQNTVIHDTVDLTVILLDLDADSDNYRRLEDNNDVNGDFNLVDTSHWLYGPNDPPRSWRYGPDRTAREESIEDTPGSWATPGRFVLLNTNDGDLDGIPDHWDGFDVDGVEDTDDDRIAALHRIDDALEGSDVSRDRLTPIEFWFSRPEGIDWQNIRVRVRYDAASTEPAAASEGTLRLWTTAADRDGRDADGPEGSRGHFLKPEGVDGHDGIYTLEQLGFQPGDEQDIDLFELWETRLFVEGVRISESRTDAMTGESFLRGQQRVEVEFLLADPEAPTAEPALIGGDSVLVTVTELVSVTATDRYAAETSADEGEPNPPADDGTFTISRGTGNTAGDLTVYFEIEAGDSPLSTAEYRPAGETGGDFSTSVDLTLDAESGLYTGSIVIPDSESSVDIRVTVHDDDSVEWDESITLRLLPHPDFEDPAPYAPAPTTAFYWMGRLGNFEEFSFNTDDYIQDLSLLPDSATITVFDNDGFGDALDRNVDAVSTGEAREAVGNRLVNVDLMDGRVTTFGAGTTVSPTFFGDSLPFVFVNSTLPSSFHGAVEVLRLGTELTFAGRHVSSTSFTSADIDALRGWGDYTEMLITGSVGDRHDDLSTGRYEYGLTVQATISINDETERLERTYVGATEYVNRRHDGSETDLNLGTAEFGAGWWIDGLDALVASDGVSPPNRYREDIFGNRDFGSDLLTAEGRTPESGIALIRGDGSSAWYSAEPDFSGATVLSSSDATPTGQWSDGDASTVTGGGNILFSRQDEESLGNTLQWTFDGLDDGGFYQLFTTWAPGYDRSRQAFYSVSGGIGHGSSWDTQVISVDQRYTPGATTHDGAAWRSLGFYSPVDGGSLTVELSADNPLIEVVGESALSDGQRGLVIADGVMLVRHWDFTTPEGSFNRLVHGQITTENSDGYHFDSGRGSAAGQGDFTLLTKWGGHQEFDGRGFLRAAQDRNGNRVEYHYEALDADDNPHRLVLDRVVEQGGLTTHFDYDAGKLETITDFAGRVTQFDIEKRRVTITLPVPGHGRDSGPEYIYDFDTSGRLRQITDAEKNVVTINYGAEGEVTISEPTPSQNPEQVQWSLTSFLSDAASNLRIVDTSEHPQDDDDAPNEVYEARATYEDARGNVWLYQFDRFGLTTTSSLPPTTDVGGQSVHDRTVWQWTRNEHGLVTQMITPPGGGGHQPEFQGELTTNYEYDDRGNLERVTYPYTDENGHEVTENWLYDQQFSQLSLHTDRRGNATGYELDARGNVLWVQDALQQQTTFEDYTAPPTSITDMVGGLVRTVTGPTGFATTYDYFESGTHVGLVREISEGTGTSGRLTTAMTYDARRNLATETDPYDRVTTYTHDVLGELVVILLPAAGTGGYALRETTNTYDRLGQLIRVTDELGRSTEYEYDASGRLTLERLPRTNDHAAPEIEYHYDEVGNLERVIDARDHEVVYKYNERNQQIRETLPEAAGQHAESHTDSHYDAVGNLQETERGRLNRDGSTTTIVTRYTYSEVGFLTTVYTPDPDGSGSLTSNKITYEHYADGTVRTETVTDLAGGTPRETAYEHNAIGQLVKQTLPDPDGAGGLGRTETTYTYTPDGLIETETTEGLTTTYRYDDQRRLREVETPATGQHAAPKVKYRYGVVAGGEDQGLYYEEVEDARGAVTRTIFDDLGRVHKVIQPQMGAWPNVVQPVTNYRYTAELGFLRTAITDPDGVETIQEFDQLGRGRKVIQVYKDENGQKNSSLDRVTKYEYDVAGNVARVTDPRGAVTSYEYDSHNRLHKQTAPAPGSLGSAHAAPITFFYHDSDGNQVAVKDPLNRETNTHFDALGRVTLTEAPGENAGTLRFTFHTYDQEGNIEKIETGGRRSTGDVWIRPEATTYTHDLLGRQTTVTTPDGMVVTQEYDELGRVVEITDSDGDLTKYIYDNLGRVVQEQTAVGVSGDGTTTVFVARVNVYDVNGNLLQRTDRNGRRIVREYDKFNRVYEEYWTEAGSSVQVYTAELEYTPGGRLHKVTDSNFTAVFQYDAFGQMNESSQSALATGAAADLPTVRFEYGVSDPRGLRTSRDLFLNGTLVSTNIWSHDDLGRVTVVSEDNNAATGALWAGGTAASDKSLKILYRADGSRDELQRFGSAQPQSNWWRGLTNYEYFQNGQVQQITHRGGPGDIIFSDQEFRYDEHGLVDRFWERSRVRNPSTGNYEYAHLREAYSHSADGQVQERGREKPVSSGGQLDITLSTGNSVDWGSDTPGGWDAGGDPGTSGVGVRDHRITSDSRYEYTYDSEGNIKTRKALEGSTPSGTLSETLVYEWDHKNRLISVTRGNSQSGTGDQYPLAAYTYDYFGRRVRKLDFGVSTLSTAYVYDGAELVAELILGEEAPPQIVRKYFNGPGVNEVVAVSGSHFLPDSGATVQMSTHQDVWYFADRQGTPRTLAIYAGPATTGFPGEPPSGPWELLHREFDSFGRLLREYGGHEIEGVLTKYTLPSEPLANAPLLWAGHVFDERVGLYQMQARWFSPDSQRFMSQDPLGFASGDHNPYRYAFNSPANFVDPDGRLAITTAAIAVLGFGLVGSAFYSGAESNFNAAGDVLSNPGFSAADQAAYQSYMAAGRRWEVAGRTAATLSVAAGLAPWTVPLYSAGSGAAALTFGQWAGRSAAVGLAEKLALDGTLYATGIDPQAFSRYRTNPGWTAFDASVSIASVGVFSGGRDLGRIITTGARRFRIASEVRALRRIRANNSTTSARALHQRISIRGSFLPQADLQNAHEILGPLGRRELRELRTFQAVARIPGLYRSIARFFGQPQGSVAAQHFLIIQRSDIFSPEHMRNNVLHIIQSRVPRLGDELINLHHIGQNPRGPFAEITSTQNRYTRLTGGPLHIPGASGVQHGTLWNNFRNEYYARRLLQAVDDGIVPRSLFDRYLRESIENGARINPYL